MIKEAELLERFYDSFINLDDTKDFFLGLNDYIDYIETTPPFNKILEELLAQSKPIEDNIKNLEPIVIERFKQIHKELTDYIKKNRINNNVISKALKEYDSWLNNRTVGLPVALNARLNTIIESLYKIPEHKNFALKYVVLSKDKTYITHYLKVKEYFDWREAEEELEYREKNELWGEMLPILELQKVIKEGREYQKELVEQSKEKGSVRTSYELSKLNLKLGEWEKIREDGIPGKPSFFKAKKFGPIIMRFQNHILEELSRGLSVSVFNALKGDLGNNKNVGKARAGLRKKIEGLGQKSEVKKITIININESKKLVAINDDFEDVGETKDYSEWWQIFVKEIEERYMTNKTDTRGIPAAMKSCFNYNVEKCPLIYKGGKYALTKIFVGFGEDIMINPEVDTEIITEKEYLSHLKRKKRK